MIDRCHLRAAIAWVFAHSEHPWKKFTGRDFNYRPRYHG